MSWSVVSLFLIEIDWFDNDIFNKKGYLKLYAQWKSF